MSQTQSATTTTSPDFVLTRVFDAPRSLVWAAFTEPERMKEWWGPKEFSVVKSKMDLRPGGSYHYGMKAKNGAVMWGKFVFHEIVPQQRMVFINSFSDEAGGTSRHSGHEKWPLEMHTIFTFEDAPGGRTKVTIRSSAHNANAEEQKTFDTSHDSMNQGWGGSLDRLVGYLARAEA